jgi:hypothetical protein
MLLVFAGLFALVLALWGAGRAERRADRIQNAGVETAGIIAELHPGRFLGPRAVTVNYRVGLVERTARVNLTDSSPRYQRGDTVAIVYDSDHPSRSTIVGETNETAFEYRLFVIGFVLGAAAAIVGSALLVFHRRVRRILRSGPWISAMGAGRGYSLGYLQVGLSVSGGNERIKELASGLKHRHRVAGKLLATPQQLQAVGDVDGRIVIRVEGHPPLLVLREPRTKRRSRGARR